MEKPTPPQEPQYKQIPVTTTRMMSGQNGRFVRMKEDCIKINHERREKYELDLLIYEEDLREYNSYLMLSKGM